MSKSKLIDFAQRRPEEALEALNRLTGLSWERMPQSLMPEVSAKLGAHSGKHKGNPAPCLRQTG